MISTARGAATAIGVLVLAACGSGGSPDGDTGDSVAVSDAWARATPAGATTGAIYVTLASDEDDALDGVAVDPSVAAAAELHMTMSNADGTSMMHALAELPLPAGETVVLAPNGDHVMLVDLARALAAGATFVATLQFTNAPDQAVTVTVRDDAP